MKKIICVCLVLLMIQVNYIHTAKPMIATALFGVGIVSGAALRITYENSKNSISEYIPVKKAKKKQNDVILEPNKKRNILKHFR